MSEVLTPTPTIPEYKWWVEEDSEETAADKLEAAKELIYLHKVGAKYEFVVLHRLRGMVVQDKFKHDPGGKIDNAKLLTWLKEHTVFSERQALNVYAHALHYNRLNNVVNCFDVGNWLVKEDLDEETTLWNEYTQGKFIWDPNTFGERKLSKPSKKEEVLYGFIKRQCSDSDKLAQHFLKCLARKFKDPFCLMGNIFVFSGEEGTGKSLLLDLVANCFGKSFATRTEQLDEQFSAAFNPYAISVIHEATQLSDKKHGLLRDRATNEEIKINVKYEIQRNYRNFTWFLMATNPSAVTRAHFLVKGQGRRYRFLTSKAEPAIFRPWLLEHGMFHPRGQGFADDIKQVLVTLAERHYDPTFIPGDKKEAVEFSCPEAREKHLTERPYIVKAGETDMSKKHTFLQAIVANGPVVLTEDRQYSMDDLAEVFGFKDLESGDRISLGRVFTTIDGIRKAVDSYSRTWYICKPQVVNQWIKNAKDNLVVFDKKTYMAWHNMNARCHNKKHASYRSYGAKGVKVCERWRNGSHNAFHNFLKDMGSAPDGAVLGRKKDEGDYEPGNVEWEVPNETSNSDS